MFWDMQTITVVEIDATRLDISEINKNAHHPKEEKKAKSKMEWGIFSLANFPT